MRRSLCCDRKVASFDTQEQLIGTKGEPNCIHKGQHKVEHFPLQSCGKRVKTYCIKVDSAKQQKIKGTKKFQFMMMHTQRTNKGQYEIVITQHNF